MAYTISYTNGERDEECPTYEAAKASILARWPHAEIGHDGDLDGLGDRTLFWACEEDSIDDDGARALGSIRGSRWPLHTKYSTVCDVAGWDHDEVQVDGDNVTVFADGAVQATDRGLGVELGTLSAQQRAELLEVVS